MSEEMEAKEPKDSGMSEHLRRFAAELSPILEHMAAKINEHDDHISRHQSYFDGIGDAHRKSQVDSLRSEHGERFKDVLGKLQTAHQALGHSETEDDFWPALHDKMQELKVGKDQQGAFMDHVHDHLNKAHEAIYGKGMESPATAAGDQGAGSAPAAEIKVEAATETKPKAEGSVKPEKADKAAPSGSKKEKPAVGSKEFYEGLGAHKTSKARSGA